MNGVKIDGKGLLVVGSGLVMLACKKSANWTRTAWTAADLYQTCEYATRKVTAWWPLVGGLCHGCLRAFLVVRL